MSRALQDHVKSEARALQIPALDRVPRRPAEDRDRQDPALQIARRGPRRAKVVASVSFRRVRSHETPIACRLRGRSARARRGAGRGPAEDRSRSASSRRSAARSRRSATTCAIRSSSRSTIIGRKIGGLPVEVIYEDDQHQAGSRQAEDREADRIRQGRFHRRLHLVERAARFAQADRRFQDLHRSSPMPAPRRSPANCARPTCSRPRGTTTRRRRPSATT